MLNVLWLASWFPSEVDPFNGDFIERHAIAVSHHQKVTVLAIVKDENFKAGQITIEKKVQGNLTVYIGYYGKTNWGKWADKFFSFKKYIQLQKKVYKIIEKEKGRPDIVHVHVTMKAGIFAYMLKKKYQIPYVVTEHWSGYNPQSKSNIYSGSWLLRKISKKILRESSLFLPVSKNLGETVQKKFICTPFQVIHNVVDTSLFFYKSYFHSTFKFIHPSFMLSLKNPEGILKACKILKEKGYNFQILLLGSKDKRLMDMANELGLLNTVAFFETAVPYKEVARQMQQSSALLLFSKYENMPCVILEALCCGLPVISSSVGGIAEVINSTNGILVESENIEQLVNAMQQLIDNYALYNREEISRKAIAQFNYDAIGKQFITIYEKTVSSS